MHLLSSCKRSLALSCQTLLKFCCIAAQGSAVSEAHSSFAAMLSRCVSLRVIQTNLNQLDRGRTLNRQVARCCFQVDLAVQGSCVASADLTLGWKQAVTNYSAASAYSVMR
jgi:hypothetical protein